MRRRVHHDPSALGRPAQVDHGLAITPSVPVQAWADQVHHGPATIRSPATLAWGAGPACQAHHDQPPVACPRVRHGLVVRVGPVDRVDRVDLVVRVGLGGRVAQAEPVLRPVAADRAEVVLVARAPVAPVVPVVVQAGSPVAADQADAVPPQVRSVVQVDGRRGVASPSAPSVRNSTTCRHPPSVACASVAVAVKLFACHVVPA
jgi:hypothetical protein